MSQTTPIRDLIYFDFDKTASLYSQLRGGLPREFHEHYVKGKEGGAGLNAPILNFGFKSNESESTTEIVQMHHDMLVAVEETLHKDNRLIDFTRESDAGSFDIATVHAAVKRTPYVRIEGTSEFRDFQMVKRLFDIFSRRQPQGASRSKSKRRNSTDQSTSSFESEIIDQLLPNRIHFAVQPFPGFTAFSNLKAECIVDRDSDNIFFHFGTKPNVDFTVFGISASVPEPSCDDDSLFADGTGVDGDSISNQFSEALNQAYAMIKPLERIENFSSYPNITVYPFAVYRTIRPDFT